MVNVGVIILHYKGEEDTLECLQSLYKSKTKNITLFPIVVANSPSVSFSSHIEKRYPKIRYIENKKNLGFAEANNIGVHQALREECKYIILLNNDTIISSELFSQLVICAQSHESIGLISPKIYFAKGHEYHSNRYRQNEKGRVIWYAGGILDLNNIYATHRGVDEIDHGQYDKITETDFATGCCMLITRNLIKTVGFFDKKYFLYFEDVDFSFRARKNGLKVLYYPKTFLWHKNAASSDKPGSSIHIYYQTRNRLYFGYKYASFMTKKSLFLDSLRLSMKKGIVRKAVFDFYLGKMEKGDI